MSIIDTTLTNTILIPASDGNASSSLAETTIVSDIEKYNNNFEKAIECFTKVLVIYPDNPDAQVLQEVCLENL